MFIRANNAPFMTKLLCEAIMTRSNVQNQLLQLKTTGTGEAYRKQRNYCLSLLRNTKKIYYENVEVKSIINNTKFWKSIKPLFADVAVMLQLI